MIRMSDWSKQSWKITLTLMLWEMGTSSVRVVFITVSKLAICNLTLTTFSLCHSILLHKLLDFMRTLKLPTHKIKLVSFWKPFNQSNPELLHQQDKVAKKSLRKLQFTFKRGLLLHGSLKTFTKNIPLFMRKVWTLSWSRNLLDTTNFFNWWLRQSRMLKKLSKVWS